jgi:hypothetical protein
MLSFPRDVLRLIYSHDPTYRHVFNLCLLQLEVLFREHRFARRLRVLGRVRVERVLWTWAGDVPVVLSWTGPDKSVGTGHSDMCGCKKCSKGARAEPKPPRVGPRPKAGARRKRYGR